MNDTEIRDRREVFLAQQKAFNECQKQLDELTQMRFRNLIADEEYNAWKEKLLQEKLRLKQKLADTDNRASRWFELSEQTFLFANQAQTWFEQGDLKTKRAILETFGSNLFLKDGILQIQAKKPFYYLTKKPKNSRWLPLVERIRTFFINHDGGFHMPKFTLKEGKLPTAVSPVS